MNSHLKDLHVLDVQWYTFNPLSLKKLQIMLENLNITNKRKRHVFFIK